MAEKPFAWIDKYFPVLNTPLDRHLEILDEDGNVAWKANLEEVVDQTDEDAHKYFDAVPAWHGLSKDGNVTGQLIYAGYGTKKEYDDLVAAGTDFTGKIVIAKYGMNFRGLKVVITFLITGCLVDEMRPHSGQGRSRTRRCRCVDILRLARRRKRHR